MKKISVLLLLCLFLLSGCGKAELEKLNLSLEGQLAEKDEEISQLNDTIDELNQKVSDAEKFVQILSDEKSELEKENQELMESAASVKASNKDSILGYWEENDYKNNQFGITFNVNDDWYIFNKEELSQLVNLSIDLVDELTDIDVSALDETAIIPLFSVNNLKSTDDITSNISLILTKPLVKENLGDLINGRRAQWEEWFSSFGEGSFEEIESTIFGNVESKCQKIIIEIGDTELVMHCKYFFFYIGDYLGTLSAAYSPLDEDAVNEVIDKLAIE